MVLPASPLFCQEVGSAAENSGRRQAWMTSMALVRPAGAAKSIPKCAGTATGKTRARCNELTGEH